MDREGQIKEAGCAMYSTLGEFPSLESFVSGAEWADAHPKSPWISVRDRLPEFNSIVLVRFKLPNLDGYSFAVAEYVNESVCCYNDRRVPIWYVHPSGGQRLDVVTHWKAIVEPE